VPQALLDFHRFLANFKTFAAMGLRRFGESHMDTIAALSALHRGLWVGLSAFDENESAYSDICTRMFDIREQASHLKPTSNVDLSFLVYVRSWYSANLPDHLEVTRRIDAAITSFAKCAWQ
jgi:hypothetical protein